MNLKRAILTLSFIFLFTGVYAQQKFALNLNVSSLGIGGEAVTNIGDNFTVRAGGNFFKMQFDGVTEDYNYTLDARLSSVPLMVDWYPGNSIFHLTAGGVVNLNKGNVILTPSRGYDIDGKLYTPQELGNVTGEMEYARFSPYFGIGFGNPLKSDGLSFSFNAGAMYQSSPKVTLNPSEILGKFYSEENDEIQQTIVDKMNNLKLYPVVTVSLSYGF